MRIQHDLYPYQNRNGRWTKTGWNSVGTIALCIFTILTVGFVTIETSRGDQPSTAGESQYQSTSTTPTIQLETPCSKVNSHSYVCGSIKDIAKWNAYLEKENEGLKAKTKKAEVTMYTSRAAETDSTPCIAANGKDICKLLKQGVQTCASNDYKLGTKLNIESLGKCIVMDRMNPRYTGTGRVDFYAGFDLERARKHGVKTLAISTQ